MGFEIETLKGWSEGRRCDYCQTASASAFCSSHSAFLCLNCDSRIHPPISHAPHERVWICEVCEQAPAALTCRADAAALCVTCDADIHSANPLARRHERVAIEPFVHPTKSRASLASYLLAPTETVSNPGAGLGVPSGQGFDSGHFGFELEFDEVKNFDAGTLLEFDSVVPVQVKPTPPLPHLPARPIFGHESNCFDIDFGASKLSPFSLVPSQSISHSVSSSSVDFGVVPDGNSMSEISFPYIKMTHSASSDVVSKGATFSSNTTTTTASIHRETGSEGANPPWLDREARVLRYREKRKNRKFEKTIRYASRKAYAEIRPRIKGRFAKRTENELYSSSASVSIVGADTQYGVVPIF